MYSCGILQQKLDLKAHKVQSNAKEKLAEMKYITLKSPKLFPWQNKFYLKLPFFCLTAFFVSKIILFPAFLNIGIWVSLRKGLFSLKMVIWTSPVDPCHLLTVTNDLNPTISRGPFGLHIIVFSTLTCNWVFHSSIKHLIKPQFDLHYIWTSNLIKYLAHMWKFPHIIRISSCLLTKA